MKEIWKPIKNWENYYLISTLGNIKCLERTTIYKNNRLRIFKERITKGSKNSTNYYYFTLNSNNKNKERFFVHRLVALHFIENPSNFPIINHMNGNPENNNINNLEWCDYSFNQNHAMRNNLFKPYTQKLNYEIANYIRKEYAFHNISQRELGIKYNLARTNINKIINNKCWKTE